MTWMGCGGEAGRAAGQGLEAGLLGAGEGWAAVTNHHKLGDLKQQTFIRSQVWRPEV